MAYAVEARSRLSKEDGVVHLQWANDGRVRDEANGGWLILGSGMYVTACERRRRPDGPIASDAGPEHS